MNEVTKNQFDPSHHSMDYVGFWQRTIGAFIDTFLQYLVIFSVGYAIRRAMGLDSDEELIVFLLNVIWPVAFTFFFWIQFNATPGKMAFDAKIVDARTGASPTIKQYVIRYFGYFLSSLPLFAGFFWIAFSKRKQGFHDILAKTIVVAES